MLANLYYCDGRQSTSIAFSKRGRAQRKYNMHLPLSNRFMIMAKLRETIMVCYIFFAKLFGGVPFKKVQLHDVALHAFPWVNPDGVVSFNGGFELVAEFFRTT